LNSDFKDIIKGCKKGKHHAQKSLYDEFGNTLYAISLRYVKNQQDAQDIIHDSFMIIFKNIKQLKDDKALLGWMKRIVVNESLRFLKKKNKIAFDYEETTTLEIVEPAKEERVPKEALRRFLLELPNGCRTIFNLYVVEGYSHIEISEQLNISVGTSKSQFHKAKSLLRGMVVSYEAKNKIA